MKYRFTTSILKVQAVVWISLIQSLCGVGLWAQSALPGVSVANIARDTAKAATEIEAIPLTEVSNEMQKTSVVLRDILGRLRNIDFSYEVDSLLPTVDSIFLKIRDEVFRDSLEGYSLRELQDVMRELTQLQIRYSSIQDQLDAKRTILEPDIELIRRLSEQWTKTYIQKVDGGIPDLLADRIQAILVGIANLKDDLNAKMNGLLIAENRLAGSMIVLRESTDIVRERLETETKHFFSANSPALWQVLRRSKDSVSVRSEAKFAWSGQQTDLRNFVSMYRREYRFQIILFIALFVILYHVKVRVNRWSKEKREAAGELSMKIIQRPLATALIITLLITPFNYPEAQEAAVRLIYLASIVPILYLVPILIPLVDRRYIYFFGILFIASQLTSFAERYYIIDRLALFAFDLIAAALYFVALRKSSPVLEVLRKRDMRFAIFCLRTLWIFHIVGLISNILGFMVMSKILSHGALVVLFAGIMIYVSAQVLKSLFNLFMYSDESRFSRVIENYPDAIKHGVHRWINIGAVAFFLYVILDEFLLYRPIVDALKSFTMREWKIGEVQIGVGAILAFFITLWIALVISKFIRILLQDEVLSRFDMKRGVPGAISMVVRICLITLGFILAFAAAGIELNNIAIIFGALGVGIGFGLQNIFNNLISGIIIAFERPIQVGDIIQIASLNLMGSVQDIGIRSSIVKTFDGAEVVVPNGNIISNEMINWTLSDRRRRQEILVGVKYGSDLNHVLEILNNVVTNHDQVMKNPEPLIVFTGFGDSALNFRVLFWTHFDVGLSTKSAVGVAIDEAFKKSGIKIPFPQRDLHIVDANGLLPDPLHGVHAPGSEQTAK
jgi:small-conductance mechanosensitive channel